MTDPRSMVEGFIRKATRNGKALQPSQLVKRIADRTGLSMLDIEDCLSELAREGLIEGVSRSGHPVKMVHWKGLTLVETNPLALTIREFFRDRNIIVPDNDCLALARVLEGLDEDDVLHLLKGLYDLQGVTDDGIFASACHLLGSAKALNGLSAANGFLKALPTQEVGEMFVITAGPADPEAVLLIENLRSFTAFSDSEHVNTILGVACYGYGLTMHNFATHLHSGKVTACPSRGERPNLKKLIKSKPVLLWGDLDKEGLRIFESLRREIPDISLSAAYAEMEKLVSIPRCSHPYHRLFDKAAQREAKGETPEVAHLNKVCCDRAIDQEALGKKIDAIKLAIPYSCDFSD